MNREPVNRAEQNRSMKNGKQNKKNCERNPDATSQFSLRFGIFFLIIFHEYFTLWTGRERARGAHAPRGQMPVRLGPMAPSPSRTCLRIDQFFAGPTSLFIQEKSA